MSKKQFAKYGLELGAEEATGNYYADVENRTHLFGSLTQARSWLQGRKLLAKESLNKGC